MFPVDDEFFEMFNQGDIYADAESGCVVRLVDDGGTVPGCMWEYLFADGTVMLECEHWVQEWAPEESYPHGGTMFYVERGQA